MTDTALADSIVGDLDEQRRRRAAQSSPLATTLWYWRASLAMVATVALRRSADSGARRIRARIGLAGLRREVAQAGRSLLRTPASTAVVVGTLALGLGLTTAIFSVVHGVLFQPLPFADPERVVIVQGRQGDQQPNLFGTSYLDYQDLRASNRTFAEMATTAYWTFTVTGTDVPLRLVGNRVSGTFFPMLGTRPAIGRWIEAADDAPGSDEVAVISHGLWHRMFGGRSSVIGEPLSLNGVPARVIGVMPEGFAFPAEDVELWVAMRDELSTVPRVSRFFATLGRLAGGVSVERAEADLSAVVAGLAREYPDAYRDWHPAVTPALPVLTDEAAPRLWLLFGAVFVVLLVAGVNLATLIAARAGARSREFAIRFALGAGRWRVARVSLLESVWLGAAGLAGGLLIAAPAAAALRALAPDDIPRLSNVSLSWPVMIWAGGVMLAFVGVGTLAPLLRLRGTAPDAIRAATVAGEPARRGRRILVAGQVAAAFLLLAAAGLLVRSFTRVLDVDPGFEPRNLALMRVFLTPPAYRSIDSQKQFVERALERLQATPGVVAAATVSQPPFDNEGAGSRQFVALEGQTYAPGTHPSVLYRAASESYFSTAGLRVVEGRGFTDRERMDSPRVVVLNRSAADRLWRGERPLGKRFAFVNTGNAAAASAAYTPADWHEVIGVVNDVATDGLEQREAPAVYAPYHQRVFPYLRWTTFVVRTERDVAVELPSIRAALQALDANQPIYAVRTMDAVMVRSLAERRFSVTLMIAFAALTLLLAVLGLYGALAQSVAARQREIGVRIAIGADRASVFRLVIGDGLRVVAAGIVVGAGVAWAGSARIESLLFGVQPTDGVTYAAIVAVLVLAGALACAVPARRASRVDPVRTLRAE